MSSPGQPQIVASHLISEWHPAVTEPSLSELIPSLPSTLLHHLQDAANAPQPHKARQTPQHKTPSAADSSSRITKKHSAAGPAAPQLPPLPHASHVKQARASSEVEHLAVLRVHRLQLGGARVMHVACGTAHTLACDAGGRVWGWGANGSGQVGCSGPSAAATATPDMLISADIGMPESSSVSAIASPVVVTALTGLTVSRVAAGGAHSAAVTADGSVWLWGDNAWGQCGVPAATVGSSVPPTRLHGALSSHVVAQARGCGSKHSVLAAQQGVLCQ
jgi:hypothetical protein